MSNKIILLLILACFAVFKSPLAESGIGPRAPWWEKVRVESSENRLVKRAEIIFEKVLLVADKRANRPPNLIVVRDPLKNWVVTLPDGNIIIRLATLEKLLNNPDIVEGVAKLAFILGHELSHLANDDFWQPEAVNRIKEYTEKHNKTDTQVLFQESSELLPNGRDYIRDNHLKELKADEWGILYMTMAGYDPTPIVGSDGASFFEEWAAETGRDSRHRESITHPSAIQRETGIRARLRSIVDNIEWFNFGVRLYQIGNYEEASLLLKRFRRHFPSREVLNNIGLVYYQLALKALGDCEQGNIYQFMMSTHLDTYTRASLARGYGKGEREQDKRAEHFRKRLGEAIYNFKMAKSRDERYLPVSINLSSAYLLAGQYDKAMFELNRILPFYPDNGEILNNLAVARFHIGNQSTSSTYQESIQLWQKIIADHPNFAEPYYNLASIYTILDDSQEAIKYWRLFLTRHVSGGFADIARKKLGIKQMTIDANTASAKRSPISLGRISANGKADWTSVTSFSEGYVKREIFRAGNQKIYSFDNIAVMVEQKLSHPLSNEQLVKNSGKPLRIISGINSRVFVYTSHAAEVRDGTVKAMVYF